MARRPKTDTLNSGSLVGVMAKAPIPGQAKTRLIPILGADGAAAFHRAAVLDTFARLAGAKHSFRCFLTPATHRSTFLQMGVPPEHLIAQRGGSLGTRMARAFGQLFAGPEVNRAVLIGTDSPDLPLSLLRQALDALKTRETVLAPAFDGGYTLIGCQRSVIENYDLAKVFRSVPWSTASTLGETAKAFSKIGAHTAILSPWRDVDEPADYLALVERYRVRVILGEQVPLNTGEFIRRQQQDSETER